MSFFSDLTNKLFPKPEESKPNPEPFIREELKRSNNDLVAYALWKESQEKEQVVSFVGEQYLKGQYENENVSLFRVIKSGTTDGFMLRFLAETDPLYFQHLFDYFKEKVKELQYTIYTSDVRTYDRNDFVERIERHYLKPSWRVLNTKAVNSTGKMNQLYGNITIELNKQNDQPQFLKFVCQHYIDSKFSEPQDFNELMKHICA